MTTAVAKVPRSLAAKAPEFLRTDRVEIRQVGGYCPCWNWFFDVAPNKLDPSVRDIVGQILRRTNGSGAIERRRGEHTDDCRPRWAHLTEKAIMKATPYAASTIRAVFAERAEDMARDETFEEVCQRMTLVAERSRREDGPGAVKVRFIVCFKSGHENHYALHPDAERLIGLLPNLNERAKLSAKPPEMAAELNPAPATPGTVDGANLYSTGGCTFTSPMESTPVTLPETAKEVQIHLDKTPGPVLFRLEDLGRVQRLHVEVADPPVEKHVTRLKEVIKVKPLPGCTLEAFTLIVFPRKKSAADLADLMEQCEPEYEMWMADVGAAGMAAFDEEVGKARKQGKIVRSIRFIAHLRKSAREKLKRIFPGLYLVPEHEDPGAEPKQNPFTVWCERQGIENRASNS